MALLSSTGSKAGARRQGGIRLLGLAWLSLLSCLPPDPSPQSLPAAAALPGAFLGEWNAALAACGSPRSESRLILEANRATFFSSQAEIIQLQVENPRRVKLTLRFASNREAGDGKPTAWTIQRRYLLSSDLQRLQDISQGEQGLIRWRCPSSQR